MIIPSGVSPVYGHTAKVEVEEMKISDATYIDVHPIK
jgi:hypothetical protein